MTTESVLQRVLSLPDAEREHKLAQLDRLLDEEMPKRWTLRSLADAYRPRPPLQYVVAGLFSIPSLSIVYGAPGSLKSFLMADACTCVAAGIPWLQPLHDGEDTARQTLHAPALWCDFDNGLRRTDERFDALGKARGLSESTPLRYVAMPSPWLDLSIPGAVDFMTATIREAGARMCVIDNLGVVSGKADENSAEMVQILSACRQIAEGGDVALVLIHHQRKSTGYNSRAGETLRGHSSIEAALDLALLAEREEHSDEVRIKSTKTRGADVLPFGALFTYEHKPGTNELATARFYGMYIEDLVSDMAIGRAAIEALGDADRLVNKGDLVDAIKRRLPDVGINRIRRQVDALALQGDILVETGERGAKLYSLPTQVYSFTGVTAG